MQLTKPMTSNNVIDALIGEVKSGTDVHAYLFEGDKGLFTCETAAYFASALLCEGEGEIPCGQCINCIQAQGGNNPDIRRMSLADITDKKSVGADEIRDIISDAYTKPFKAAKKVYIIEDGDSLTAQAQNAMLKILEEPPSYVVFIICVTNAELILQTVRSRSRIVRFAPAPDKEVARYVKEKYPHMADKADFVASFAGGIYGRADYICADDSFADMREKAFDITSKLIAGENEDAIFEMCAMFEEYKGAKGSDEGASLMLDFMLSFVGDAIRILNGAANMIVNSDKGAEMNNLCRRSSISNLDFAAQRIMETKQMLSRYVNQKAAVMRLAISIFYGK